MYVSGWTDGAPSSGSRRGLGQASDDGTVLSDAAQWIRDRWAQWLALEPAILDLQHRAAVVAAEANRAGDTETYQRARRIILDLGELGQLHLRITDRVQSVGSWLGLDSLEGYGGAAAAGTVGAIPVPVALATLFAGLALVMAWLFQRVDLQRDLVAGLEAGTLTREDLEQLNERPPATDVLSQGVDLARLALWAFLAFVAWKVAGEVGGWRSNPDLLIFEGNPGDGAGAIIGERVHALSYRHAEDGAPYVHDFGAEVELYGLEDGTVQLRHRRGKRLWRDF